MRVRVSSYGWWVPGTHLGYDRRDVSGESIGGGGGGRTKVKVFEMSVEGMRGRAVLMKPSRENDYDELGFHFLAWGWVEAL